MGQSESHPAAPVVDHLYEARIRFLKIALVKRNEELIKWLLNSDPRLEVVLQRLTRRKMTPD